MGGVGKTSITFRFAHESMSGYGAIVWMRSKPTKALDQSCRDALQHFGIAGDTELLGSENKEK
jgi:hypothetical protein